MRKDKRTNFEKESDRLFDELQNYDPASEEYAKVMTEVGKLSRAKGDDPQKMKIDPNVLVRAGVYLTGLLVILHFEDARIITSKAFNHLMKINP